MFQSELPNSPISLRFQEEVAFYRRLTEEPQEALHTGTDQQIYKREENGRQGCHDQNHDRGQQNLTPRGPDNFARFRANLLNKLKRISDGHAPVFPGNTNVQVRDIRRVPVDFKNKGYPVANLRWCVARKRVIDALGSGDGQKDQP